MAKAKPKTIYDVHPGMEMIQKWVAELKEKTGRTLEEWIALVRAEGREITARVAEDEAQIRHQ